MPDLDSIWHKLAGNAMSANVVELIQHALLHSLCLINNSAGDWETGLAVRRFSEVEEIINYRHLVC